MSENLKEYMAKARHQMQEWKEHGIPLEVWNREMAGVNRYFIALEKEIERLKNGLKRGEHREYCVFVKCYNGWQTFEVMRSKRKAFDLAKRVRSNLSDNVVIEVRQRKVTKWRKCK